MVKMTPGYRPQITRERAEAILQANGVDLSKPAILGMRGYFRDSMGVPGENDRGIYDDAAVLISPTDFRTFNFNTDPSRVRKGHGFSEATKGMAVLMPGVWMYKKGLHRNSYWAFVQAQKVTVMRDGNPNYLDTGWFGINIHKGGDGTTSSMGCQTVVPLQYRELQRNGYAAMDRYKVIEIPYCLVEQQG